jgi:DNA-binding response OmpR family regulator
MAVGELPLANERDPESSVLTALRERGIRAVLVAGEADLDAIRTDEAPDVALVDVAAMARTDLEECVRRCMDMALPVIALVQADQLADLDEQLAVDDFVLSPPHTDELIARAGRALRRKERPETKDAVRIGDLAINTANYEVSMKGRRINLRFKEYELLLLMATNPGRVYTREALLNQIWGYEYLGGTRTVDVHIRRLRSKIEDADHPFIETVWGLGYRFRAIKRTA